MDSLDGGCACGQLRYRLCSKPMFVHCCHCRDCQRQTGSAFVLNALIETDRVAILSGATEAIQVPTESGRPHVIYRCEACKIAIWSHNGGVRPLSLSGSAHSMNRQRCRRTFTSTPARNCLG